MSKVAGSPVVRTLLPVGRRRRVLAVAVLRRIGSASRGPVGTPAEVAKLREEAKLRRIWARHDPEMLELYLVSGFQDPRLNAQSILARHTLVRGLFGSDFDDLMRAEFAFAVELNEAIRQRGRELGVRLSATMDPERQAAVQRVMEVIADRAPTFAARWRAALADRTAPPLRVLEFACGSANDYRAFADYGIARFLDYTGVDLNEKNIANAKRRFPDVDFRLGSVLSLQDPDGSVDYVIGFDILEHLSLQSMQIALDSAVRLCRRGVYFAFFSMDDVPEHDERPRGNYYVNLLSRSRMRSDLADRFSSVQLIHLPTMLEEQYGYPRSHSYNRRAYSLLAEGPRIGAPECAEDSRPVAGQSGRTRSDEAIR